MTQHSSPALKKSSLFQKLLISNLFFGFILVLLLIVTIRAKNELVDFTILEKKGNQFQRPLATILENISEHQVLAQRLLFKGSHDTSSLAPFAKNIDEGFVALEKVHHEIGAALQFTEAGLASRKREHVTIATVKAEWEELKTKVLTLKHDVNIEKHAHLIGDVRTMITHIGDTSNLILDPELDSYYLMDATLVAYPQIQDRLQSIMTFMEPILRRHDFKNLERTQLAVFTTLLKQSDYDRITADVETCLHEDVNSGRKSPSLLKNLPEITKQLTSTLDPLLEIMNRLTSEKVHPTDIKKFEDALDLALDTSFRAFEKSIDELDRLLDIRITERNADKNMSILWSILALLLFGSFVFWFARYLSRTLGMIIDSLEVETSRIRDASYNINNVSLELAQSTSDQSAALQETAASMEEMNAMISINAQSVKHSKELSDKSHSVAIQGKKTMDEMVNAIQEIDQSNTSIVQQVEEGNRQISEIVKMINEIGNKTKVINDIVFQTKLLSFNASVEAARAGEHGKGFAVVAEEVGNLAQMSGNAAKEISDMLSVSILKVETIIKKTKSQVELCVAEGKMKVQSGAKITESCGNILEELVRNVTETNTTMSQIESASTEEAQGVKEISNAMNNLDKVTHQNTSASQKASNLSMELSRNADSLTKLVGLLEIEVHGKKKKNS